MAESLRALGGGIGMCTCQRLPHDKDCPVAPYFTDDEKIQLDSEVYADPPAPFHIKCPHCKGTFDQFSHAVGYDYTPTEGQTDQNDLPLVCPLCAWSDKQTLPALVGYNPAEEEDDDPFVIICPECGTEWDRTDGVMDVWLEREVLMGVESAHVRGILYYKGQIVTEYTELSIACLDCGHACGEDTD